MTPNYNDPERNTQAPAGATETGAEYCDRELQAIFDACRLRFCAEAIREREVPCAISEAAADAIREIVCACVADCIASHDSRKFREIIDRAAESKRVI